MSSTRNAKFVWQDKLIASEVSPNTRLAGLVMAAKDNGDGRGFFLSMNDLATGMNVSGSTAKRARNELRNGGWIEVVRTGGRAGNGARWATEYRLTLPSQQVTGDPLTLESQQVRSESQWVKSDPQQVTGDPPVEPLSLDPPPVDPSPPEERKVVVLEYPCFEHGRIACGCEGSETPGETVPEVVPCINHPSFAIPCHYCAEEERLAAQRSRHSDLTQRGRHEDFNEGEGLAGDGDGPLEKRTHDRYQGRNRS